jgi:site-specific DNA recombinase
VRQAVIYTRFSPRPNSTTCESCEFQEQQAREYCEQHGIDVLGVFRDKAASGKNMKEKDRPGLNKALTMVTRYRAILVCYNLARLSRSVKDLCHIAELLNKRYAHLVFVTEQIDTTTAIGRFFFHMMAAFAQWRRESTGEHTRAVLLDKQKRGYLVSRDPPFGYQFAPQRDWEYDKEREKWKKKIVTNPEEQETIAIARRLAKEGKGATAICRILSGLGRRPRGGKWHRNSVVRILDKRDD